MIRVILLLLCIFLPSISYPEDTKLVETYIAKKQSFSSQVNLIGTITSNQETIFTAKFDSTLKKIYFPDGAVVRKGELIAEMDNEDTLNTYQLAEQSEIIAKDQYNRALKLYNQGYLKREELDIRKQKWHIEKQNLTKAKKSLDDSYLKAPFDGKLGVFKAKQSSHLKTGSEIVRLYNPEQMQIDLNIPENLAKGIKVGTQVSLGGHSLRISSIEHIVNKESRMVEAKINITNKEVIHNIMVGNIIEVLVNLSTKDAALVIPKSTIFIKEGKSHLFKIHQGKAQLTEVKIGEQTDKLVEVIEGLNEGDEVILYGQSNIQDGNLVKVHKQ